MTVSVDFRVLRILLLAVIGVFLVAAYFVDRSLGGSLVPAWCALFGAVFYMTALVGAAFLQAEIERGGG